MCRHNRFMRYENIKDLKDKDFKRLTGVSHTVFEKMLAALKSGLRDFGRTPNLSREDQLLMTLMYWREYRTQFHIGVTYGVSESTVCRTIKKVENVLMKSGEFRLPGKKALIPSDNLIEVALIDATEQPIERPKKSNESITAAKRNDIPKKHS